MTDRPIACLSVRSQVVCAYGSVPFPMMHGSRLPDALNSCGDTLPWRPLSGCPEQGTGRCFGQSVTLRGLEGRSLVRYEVLSLIVVNLSHNRLRLCWACPVRGGNKVQLLNRTFLDFVINVKFSLQEAY